jgi:hypothetical protein
MKKITNLNDLRVLQDKLKLGPALEIKAKPPNTWCRSRLPWQPVVLHQAHAIQ